MFECLYDYISSMLEPIIVTVLRFKRIHLPKRLTKPAIEPRASAASCLTIGCSFVFLSVIDKASEACLFCNWPKTYATCKTSQQNGYLQRDKKNQEKAHHCHRIDISKQLFQIDIFIRNLL